jgi:hypothetical protein
MTNCYIDHFTYLRSPSGLEYASLIGNSARLSSAVSAAGTNVPITIPTQVQLNQYDHVTIFDGPNSEVVTVASLATVPSSSFTISAPGFQFAHAAGTPLCSDGILGSLADQIIDASAELEAIAFTSLFQAAYTGEVLQIPSMDATIDNQRMLLFRPKHIPITALSAVSLAAIQGQPFVLDATQAFIDSGGQYARIPVLNITGTQSQVYFPQQPMNRQAQQWLTIGYTAGFTPASMPADIRDAAVLLTSDILSRRQNPTGADQISLGKKLLVNVIRGDFSGHSLWYKQATRKLAKYTRRPL